MTTKEWVALITGLLGIASSVFAVLRYFVKKEQIEGDLKRLQERYEELDERHRALLQVVGTIKVAGTASLLLKSAIDADLELAMKGLQATASSILVPLPGKEPSKLIFLAAHGPAASKLRRAAVSIDKGIAGYVYTQGRPYLAVDARVDKNFFKGVDVISNYTTTDMLCVAIRSSGRVIGVMQFLNKSGNEEFSQQDLQIAERFGDSIAPKMVEFTAEPRNFELLGFSRDEPVKDGSVVFCDLTASSLLLDSIDFASAIGLMNAYLERNCDIAMKHGGTVDKLLGDGAMFRFNVPHTIPDHRFRAIQAAVEMRDDFEHLKAGWLESGLPVSPLFTRIGIASGDLREAIMGHPQYQSLTIMGEPIVLASNLCSGAPRDRNVVLSDEETILGMERRITAKPISVALLKKIKGRLPGALEVTGFAIRSGAGMGS